MIKKLSIFLLFLCVIGGARADDFDFDEFAITDGADADFMLDGITINDDASGAGVSGFDIAGVMLGMGFDDVETLFYKTKGLYAPRKKNSIVYYLKIMMLL